MRDYNLIPFKPPAKRAPTTTPNVGAHSIKSAAPVLRKPFLKSAGGSSSVSTVASTATTTLAHGGETTNHPAMRVVPSNTARNGPPTMQQQQPTFRATGTVQTQGRIPVKNTTANQPYKDQNSAANLKEKALMNPLETQPPEKSVHPKDVDARNELRPDAVHVAALEQQQQLPVDDESKVPHGPSRSLPFSTFAPQNLKPTANYMDAHSASDPVATTNSQQPIPTDTSTLLSKKSDAIILDLQSTIRQLKHQLELVQADKANSMNAQQQQDALTQLSNNLHLPNNDNTNTNNDSKSVVSQRELLEAYAKENAHLTDARMGELQVQLDRAHAQILTADMVRKELEDTLEAEQYTWELRAQDQDRAIAQLQAECEAVAHDLVACRNQWKEAEAGWTKEVQELASDLQAAQAEAAHWKRMQINSNENNGGDDTTDANNQWKERLLELEQERAELQACLDEALKELEAVDMELQTNENDHVHEELRKRMQSEEQVLEGLQHLYRWLLERNGQEDNVYNANPMELIAAIQSLLERLPGSNDWEALQHQLAEVQSQLEARQDDLQAREGTNAELRQSLQEAVAHLKPLQDAVAKSDKDRAQLQQKLNLLQAKQNEEAPVIKQQVRQLKQELNDKEDEIDTLKQETESLAIQLSRAKVMAASSLVQANKTMDQTPPQSPSKAREELRAKRASENTLKQLLNDAQSRFSSLHEHNKDIASKNEELKERLREAESHPSDTLDTVDVNVLQLKISQLEQELNARDRKIQELQTDLSNLKSNLAVKDQELRKQSQAAVDASSKVGSNANPSSRDVSEFAQIRIRDLESKQTSLAEELKAKKDAEKKLNRSLKEALTLLQPLQMHLEDAEHEKKELMAEIATLKELTGNNRSSPVKSRETNTIRNLQQAVSALESENSKLHDALEDMSQSVNMSHLSGQSGRSLTPKDVSRLREEIVQLKSRNQVAQGRLEDAYVENQTLVESLNKRDLEERAFADEINALREKLQRSEAELESTKFIATSALVKMEEMSLGRKQSNNEDQQALYHRKANELERKLQAQAPLNNTFDVQRRLT
jgi:hypothetical protein